MKLNVIQSSILAAFLLMAVAGGNAGGAPVTVPDFSWEVSTNIPGGSVATSGTNWIFTGNGGCRIQNFNNTLFTGTDILPPPADGTNCFVEIINDHPAFCWQDIGLLQTNTQYTLTIAAGQNFSDGSGVGKIALINGSSPFQTVLAEAPVDTASVTPGGFSDFSLTYISGYQAGGHLTILMQGDSGNQLIFDNVRLNATTLPLSPTAVIPRLSTPSGTIYRGTQVTLSELPAGGSPFTYQWQSDKGTGGATFTNISGASGSTYVVDTAGYTVGSPVQFRVVVTNSLGTSTSPVVTLTAIEGPPVIRKDTVPVQAYDVEGSQVTFTATVDGSGPMTYQWYKDGGSIPNAKSAALTLNNLQVTDSGSYYVEAVNALGTVTSTPATLTVDPRPADVDGIVISMASQLGLGKTNTFSPTWVVAPNSLISGAAPSSSVGNFTLERAGGIPVLTDDRFGTLPAEGNASVEVATCGRISAGAGSSIVYKMPTASNGYDLTNVVVYGGWSDAGRDQQQYSIFYSTVATPTNFDNLIAYVNFQPINTINAQCATRVTLIGTNGVVARNVAAVKIDFNILVADTENGYTGYAEFQVFGKPSAPAPVLSVDTQPATASDVVGSQMIFVAGFTSDTPMTYQWRRNTGNGPVDITGATSATLTLNNLQLSDSGAYSLKASNASGSSVSRSSTLVVNARPDPDANGVIVSPANQTGTGSRFTPTWPITAGSLIAGLAPTVKQGNVGSFMLEGAGGLPRLTDGTYGAVGSANNATHATCGTSAGQSVTYTLAGSQSGYNITNIAVYAGWSDRGRDQQAYTVLYSTIAEPDNFIALSSTDYNPAIATGIASADRVTFSSSTASPLAANVARIRFDFTSPAGENAYSGYAELAVYGAPSAAVSLPPIVMTDTLPATGSDVVGSEVTFTARFNGTTPMTYQWRKDTGAGPVDIPGATNDTLTIKNLQLSASGSYSVQAVNANGSATSTANTFTVNPAPTPANGVLVATANQTSSGFAFAPTWTIAAGSLLAGLAPSSVGSGDFATEGGGGTVVLTDGKFASVGGDNSSLGTAGVGAGTTVTYTFVGSAAGYDLTSIVTYGGWGDNGRDEQHYTVSYSTVAAPATFVTLASASYNPTVAASTPTADRITITSASTAPLATNAAAVRFNFTSPTGENGWSGYAELGVFGVASVPVQPLAFQSATVSNGNLVMAGVGGTPGAGYTVLASTNAAAPLTSWITNSVGVFDNTGAFSTAIPIRQTDPAWFFKLRVP